jgi:hypothetical protein
MLSEVKPPLYQLAADVLVSCELTLAQQILSMIEAHE